VNGNGENQSDEMTETEKIVWQEVQRLTVQFDCPVIVLRGGPEYPLTRLEDHYEVGFRLDLPELLEEGNFFYGRAMMDTLEPDDVRRNIKQVHRQIVKGIERLRKRVSDAGGLREYWKRGRKQRESKRRRSA